MTFEENYFSYFLSSFLPLSISSSSKPEMLKQARTLGRKFPLFVGTLGLLLLLLLPLDQIQLFFMPKPMILGGPTKYFIIPLGIQLKMTQVRREKAVQEK